MATYFDPNRIEEIVIMLKVKLGHGGEHNREMIFTDKQNNVEAMRQLVDLLLSACDLASAALKPD